MIIKLNYQLDLLRKRRESNNSERLTYSKIKSLRKKGLLFGLLISSLGLSICALMSFHTFKRIEYKKILINEAKEYEVLKTKYNSNLVNLKSVYKVNNQIAQGIIGIKSGSALLLELKNKLPKSIQLITIKSEGKDLILQGRANQPSALSQINSFVLQLSDSFLINNSSVFLSKATEAKNKDGNYLNFTLSSKFSNPTYKEILANYQRLGSLGLFKRVTLLEKEGLIKWQIFPHLIKRKD